MHDKAKKINAPVHTCKELYFMLKLDDYGFLCLKTGKKENI